MKYRFEIEYYISVEVRRKKGANSNVKREIPPEFNSFSKKREEGGQQKRKERKVES